MSTHPLALAIQLNESVHLRALLDQATFEVKDLKSELRDLRKAVDDLAALVGVVKEKNLETLEQLKPTVKKKKVMGPRKKKAEKGEGVIDKGSGLDLQTGQGALVRTKDFPLYRSDDLDVERCEIDSPGQVEVETEILGEDLALQRQIEGVQSEGVQMQESVMFSTEERLTIEESCQMTQAFYEESLEASLNASHEDPSVVINTDDQTHSQAQKVMQSQPESQSQSQSQSQPFSPFWYTFKPTERRKRQLNLDD